MLDRLLGCFEVGKQARIETDETTCADVSNLESTTSCTFSAWEVEVCVLLLRGCSKVADKNAKRKGRVP